MLGRLHRISEWPFRLISEAEVPESVARTERRIEAFFFGCFGKLGRFCFLAGGALEKIESLMDGKMRPSRGQNSRIITSYSLDVYNGENYRPMCL
jgi:hypothetical protein